MSDTFTVYLEGPSFELSIDEIWPDEKDRPEDPTEEDVIEAMKEYGSVARVIRDWNLDDGIEINVTGHGGFASYS